MLVLPHLGILLVLLLPTAQTAQNHSIAFEKAMTLNRTPVETASHVLCFTILISAPVTRSQSSKVCRASC